ncbi:MAG: CDP-diacylglycerol--glycerol-3-phosphate 3-phosphatidyltransferase [Erysipelotrichales bacterium]|nr:CDP-diacylglycerol--glycerol-3-phosphate 3-phosphatidyltransferase [Erysipelotrichales bacterium]
MNLPNILTVIRMLLVPVIVLVFYFPYSYFNIDLMSFQFGNVSLSIVNIVAVVIFAVASFTDFLDGYIARKNNLVTTFGKFMDPIADKLLVNTLFIVLATRGIVPAIPVIVMVWRDTIVDALRLTAAEKGKVVSAGFLGKLKTVLQMVALIFILINNLPFELYGLPVSDFLLWSAMIASVLSGVYYFVQLKDYVLESM